MKYKVVFSFLGRLLLGIGLLMMIPAAVSFYFGESGMLNAFLITAAIVVLVSAATILISGRGSSEEMGLREGFLLVTVTWVFVSLEGAFPFYLSGHLPHFVDALFESTSGFTTTGASVFSNVENLPKGLLFWRDFTQWLGGMGIIVLAIAILPHLSVGGMQLIKSETPGPTFEQLKPRIKQTALSLWKVYILLSLILVAILIGLGMPAFDSVCHMFGTMATGGFSTQNESIGAYDSRMIHMVIAVFMLLAGTNFVLHYAWLHGKFRIVISNTEWRFYMSFIMIAVFLISTNLHWSAGHTLVSSLSDSFFQVTSLISTTGFSSADFDTWPHLSRGILFVLMFVGGCAGSTAGGMKQVRFLILFKKARQSIMQCIYPKAVIPIKIDKKTIPEDVTGGVSSLFLIYLVLLSFAVLCLLAFNIDFVTSTSAVVASMSNIGPGFGDVGPSQNYAQMPGLVKLFLSGLMIVGRLEFFTVLVLFLPVTWRR